MHREVRNNHRQRLAEIGNGWRLRGSIPVARSVPLLVMGMIRSHSLTIHWREL